jgi:glycosyltransferase involved in cell wall biosynthesis
LKLVIVDNGSTDETTKLLASIPRQFASVQVVIAFEVKRGLAAAR